MIETPAFAQLRRGRRMTKEARNAQMKKDLSDTPFRHSDFVIPSSLDIRHSSFVIPQPHLSAENDEAL
jgi:hypothetical protein